MKHRSLQLLAFTASLYIAGSSLAHAQLNNKPFAFRGTPNGGVGMSLGGQQAIFNQKILGATPDNLIRNNSGVLLNVSKGPNNSAIVSYEGNGGFLPTFRGTSFKGNNKDMAVGVFNSFFSPNKGNSSFSPAVESVYSSYIISTLTARVASGIPISYLPNNSVDSWTSLVYTSAN